MAVEINIEQRGEEAFYTVKSLAERLSVSLGTAKSMVKEGEIPSYKFRGIRRIDPADVASYLAEHREEAA